MIWWLVGYLINNILVKILFRVIVHSSEVKNFETEIIKPRILIKLNPEDSIKVEVKKSIVKMF